MYIHKKQMIDEPWIDLYTLSLYTTPRVHENRTVSRMECHNLMRIGVDSRFAPSQWETALLYNDVSHWLGASLELSLRISSLATSTDNPWPDFIRMQLNTFTTTVNSDILFSITLVRFQPSADDLRVPEKVCTSFLFAFCWNWTLIPKINYLNQQILICYGLWWLTIYHVTFHHDFFCNHSEKTQIILDFSWNLSTAISW